MYWTMWICLMYTYVYSIHIHEPHEFAWKWYPKNWINKSWFRIMVVHHHHIIIWFDLIWIELISFDFIWFHLISFDFIWFHLVSFDFNWFHLTSFDFIWFHLISTDFIWFHISFHFIPFDVTCFDGTHHVCFFIIVPLNTAMAPATLHPLLREVWP